MPFQMPLRLPKNRIEKVVFSRCYQGKGQSSAHRLGRWCVSGYRIQTIGLHCLGVEFQLSRGRRKPILEGRKISGRGIVEARPTGHFQRIRRDPGKAGIIRVKRVENDLLIRGQNLGGSCGPRRPTMTSTRPMVGNPLLAIGSGFTANRSGVILASYSSGKPTAVPIGGGCVAV